MVRVDLENVLVLDHRFLILVLFVVLLSLGVELGEFVFVALARDEQTGCEQHESHAGDGG